MGKFFNTLHVKTVKRETFIECFEWIMKKEGFVPCSDNDEAEVSFAAAFSEGGWVSLSNNEESADGLSKLSERLKKDLKLASFTVEAVDSDFAILELRTPYSKTSRKTSRLVVGDGEGYGVEKAPILIDDWRPLFQNGGVEEFLAAAGQDGVFVEDALCELGKILGIKPAVMAWCYDEFEEKIGRGGEVISLAFKKKAEKKLTLNAAFKQVFGEELEQLGFKLIKSKHPYFVKVVSDETIHYVTTANARADGRGWDGVKYKCFDVFCGISTVYKSKIDFDTDPGKFHFNGFDSVSEIYAEHHRFDLDVNYCSSISAFYYNPTDNKFLVNALEKALAVMEKHALPVMGEVVTLEKCMDYFELMNHHLFLTLEGGGEGLLCTKLFSADEYVMFCGRSCEREIERCRLELDSNPNSSPKRRASLEERIEYITSRREEAKRKDYEAFTDPELQEKAPAELERRKKENTEKLRAYGLEI